MSVSGPIVAVALQPEDAVTTLFFHHLAPRHSKLQVERLGAAAAASLGAASALIVSRGLFECAPLVHAARALRVPVYYFLDDNFMVLREELGAAAPYLAPYTVDAVRRALQQFAGVLLSSPPLVDFFSEQRLHDRLMLFPPSTGAPLRGPAETAGVTRVAFFGGQHLRQTFVDVLLPAVRRLALRGPVTLQIVGLAQDVPQSPGLTVRHWPYFTSYDEGVQALARDGVDLLLHPVVNAGINNVYKNPHALITAHALGAVPIVSDRQPYAELRGDGAMWLCDDSVDSWEAALVEAADPAARRAVRDRLSASCQRRFDGQTNIAALDAIMASAPPGPASTVAMRSALAQAVFVAHMGWRAARRVLPAP